MKESIQIKNKKLQLKCKRKKSFKKHKDIQRKYINNIKTNKEHKEPMKKLQRIKIQKTLKNLKKDLKINKNIEKHKKLVFIYKKHTKPRKI